MIATNNVDKHILFRRIQLHRKDVLKSSHNIYVLSVLRQVKNCGTMGIAFHLRKIKRATPYNVINESLKSLIAARYVRQSSGKGSLYYITEQGLQALKDFSDSIECADYVNYNKKAPISKKVKRPGL